MKTHRTYKFASGLVVAFALISSGCAQPAADTHQHSTADSAGPPPSLSTQLEELRDKVRVIELQIGAVASPSGEAAPVGGMNMSANSSTMATGGSTGMNMGGGMGMMKGMGNMGEGMMGMMSGMGGNAGMSMQSALPGFPGASHLYHIGATGFFLDHPDHITLSTEQQAGLNRIREKALLENASADRKVEEAEQQLWELTADGEPDVGRIEAKIREIEKLRGDQRLAFIRSVGEAAQVLTHEQHQSLTGMHEVNASAAHLNHQP